MNLQPKYPQAVETVLFRRISEIAAELNVKVYAIGGVVRDYILERDSSKDIDILVQGDAISLAHKVAAALPHKPKVQFFKTYGVAMLRERDSQIEFVSARKESYSKNSRNPKVTKGTLKDDQNRRDFTINTLAFSLNKEDYGLLLDPFLGVEDLKNKIIRTPLNPVITYSDDPLRMLRAIRFAAQLHFNIEKDSLQAIADCVDRIKIITKERIVQELHKIILSAVPSRGFLLLKKTGLLAYFLPELLDLEGVEEIQGQRHKDNFYHTLKVLDNIAQKTDDLWLRWAALLHDIGKAHTKKFCKKNGWTFHNHEYIGAKMVYKIFKRLKMPLNQKMKYVQKVVFLSSRPIALVGAVTDSAVRRLLFDAGETLEDLMLLCKADITTKNPKRFARYHRNFQEVSEKIKRVEQTDHIRNFQPPISGKLIMQTFNLQPCREIGIIKEHIKEAILEGNIANDYQQAYDLMIKKAKTLGLNVT